jgi:hypothetical protein
VKNFSGMQVVSCEAFLKNIMLVKMFPEEHFSILVPFGFSWIRSLINVKLD